MEDKLYVPAEDPYFRDPYIDVEEWRDTPVRHYYVHGGFHGTDINGESEARFALYFPEKEKYEGRFFQYLSPAPESENATESQTGEDNKIAFALTHGAYFVVSNQGGFMLGGDSSRLYKVSANTAEFSRKVANAFMRQRRDLMVMSLAAVAGLSRLWAVLRERMAFGMERFLM